MKFTQPSPRSSLPLSRLLSLDALRGFTMLWIVGADSIGASLSGTRGGSWLQTLAAQFDHAPWAGLHFYDLIMPLFLFMVGVAVPYSMESMAAQNLPRSAVASRILRRTVLLFVLGVIYYYGFNSPTGELRLAGTLQRIAVCYCAASFIYLWVEATAPRRLIGQTSNQATGAVASTRTTQTLALICAAILVAYWAALALIPVPVHGAGDFAEGHNLANWFDSRFLPGRKWDGDHDPEGILSTLNAISTVLIGVIAGIWLRRPDRTPSRKAAVLALAGVVLVAIGLLWAIPFPVVKKIWTSSYAVLTGGISLLFLAAFYWIIDIRNLRAWAMPFVWLGTNALTIYMVCNIVDFGALAKRFVGGPIAQTLDALWPGLAGLSVAALSIALCLWLCRFLYQRKIFLRL